MKRQHSKQHVTFGNNSLPQQPSTTPSNPLHKLVILFVSAIAITLIVITLLSLKPRNDKTDVEIPLAFDLNRLQKEQTPSEKNEENDDKNLYHKLTIEEGYALYTILKKRGLSDGYIDRFIKNKDVKETFNSFKPGGFLEFKLTPEKTLQWMRYAPSKLTSYRITPKAGSYHVEKEQNNLEKRLEMAQGRILVTLYGSGLRAGIPESIITQMIDAFSWKIDFKSETKKNDTFAVLYEAYYNAKGEKISTGNLIAALYKNRGKTHRATAFNVNGETRFYDSKGRNLNKTFNRYPLGTKYAVTSSYNPKRIHPIFKTIRPHRGTDFGAPIGTPVRAPSAATVKFSGWQRGYGRTLILDHGQGITTLYAHLSKFGKSIKRGRKVKQNQIVAKVGSTGASTGPHLHYEFRVNGKHKNPMKVKLAHAAPLPKKHLAEFKKTHKKHQRQLDIIRHFAEPAKP